MIFYIGDTSREFASKVKSKHQEAVFFLEDTNHTSPVLYGSVGDANIGVLLPFLMRADEIFADINLKNKKTHTLTCILLFRLITVMHKKVHNFDRARSAFPYMEYLYKHCSNAQFHWPEENMGHSGGLPRHWGGLFNYSKKNFTGLVDYRKSSGKQIWSAGCSFAEGTGLPDMSYSYPAIFAKKVGLPLSRLCSGGTSISWSADQILRSNLQPGDILLWGITGIHRHDIYDKECMQHGVHIGYIDRLNAATEEKMLLLDNIHSKDRIGTALQSVTQVIQKCTSEKINLKIMPHPELSFAKQYDWLQLTLESHPGFINLYGDDYSKAIFLEHISKNGPQKVKNITLLYKDLGSDNSHPGIQTHQSWADIIFKHMIDTHKG